MRNLNSNQKGSIDTLSKSVNRKLVREEEPYAAKNTGNLHGAPMNQAFIVEWQMQSNESAESNKKSSREIETAIYLH